MFKARAFAELGACEFVESQHEIKLGDMVEPAMILKSTFAYFPENTFHLLSVGILGVDYDYYLIGKYRSQWFIAPDNGVLALALNGLPVEWFRVPIPPDPPFFTAAEIFLPMIALIVKQGYQVPPFFEPTETFQRKLWVEPSLNQKQVKLTVIYNDAHGNAYINLDKRKFEEWVGDKPFRIRLSRNDFISQISPHLYKAGDTEVHAIWGYGDLLQIVIFNGSAARYLDLKPERMLIMEIEPNDHQNSKNDLSSLIDRRI